MTPSIGRIVHYTLSERDADNIMAARREGQIHGNPVAEGRTYPMVVVCVHGRYVNGKVLLDGDDTYWATSVEAGTEPGTFAWPSRIESPRS